MTHTSRGGGFVDKPWAQRRGFDALLEREAEMTLLDGLVTAVRTGSGSLLYFEGPPGIGKTRLLEEARAIAADRDVAVLSALATEIERAVPFGVVRRLFEPAVAALSSPHRDQLFSGSAALATGIVDPAGEAAGEEGDQAATLHGLYWLLESLAAEQPVGLIVDDAHWADAASLRWLEYIAPRLAGTPAIAIVAARSGESGEPLAALRRASGVQLAHIRELSPAGSAALVRELLDPGAEPGFCAACHRAAGGNPFFLRELVAELRRNGVATTRAGAERVGELAPAAIERAVERRLAGLNTSAAALARAVAVLGECELPAATRLAALDRDSAIDAADELVATEILRSGRPLRFTHPLVQAAVRASIPPHRRAATHLEAARAMWEGAGPREQVVAHLLEAEPAGEGWVVAALRQAATDAAAGGDPESAVTLLRRSLAEPPDADELPATLYELGALEARLREPEAVEHLRRALDGAGSDEERWERALALHRAIAASFRWREAAEVIDRAAERLRPTRPDLASDLEIELIANTRLNPSTRPAALERIGRLATDGTPSGKSERLLCAVRAHEAELAGDPAANVAELARSALGDGALLEEQGPDSPSLYYAAQALAATDAVEEAERHYAQALEAARLRGSVLGFVLASCFRSGSALRRGAIREAEAEARGALEATGESGWGPGLPAAAAFLVAALIERDMLDEAASTLEAHGLGEETVTDSLVANHLLLNRGRLRIARGNTRAGVDDLLAFGRRAEAWGAPNPAAFPWRSGAALAFVALGDRAVARELSERELELAREFGAPRAVGIALRAAGVARGGKRGLRMLRESVAILEDSPARLDHARSLMELGVAIHDGGDAETAREPLRAALDLAYRCGADALAGRARDELRRAGGRPRRPMLSGRDSLTPSELRVCEMAAARLKNREIAQQLFVTLPTVEAHLRNGYRKLGIISRENLSAALSAEGSTDALSTARDRSSRP